MMIWNSKSYLHGEEVIVQCLYLTRHQQYLGQWLYMSYTFWCTTIRKDFDIDLLVRFCSGIKFIHIHIYELWRWKDDTEVVQIFYVCFEYKSWDGFLVVGCVYVPDSTIVVEMKRMNACLLSLIEFDKDLFWVFSLCLKMISGKSDVKILNDFYIILNWWKPFTVYMKFHQNLMNNGNVLSLTKVMIKP